MARYVLDGFPVTENQVRLMEARNIVPARVLNMVLDAQASRDRGTLDRTSPDRYTQLQQPRIVCWLGA